MALGAARSLRGRGRGCPNGVAQTVPVSSALPTVRRCLCCTCLSNVCRSPPPRSRLPVWVACLIPHTGGSFTHVHLASSFPGFDSLHRGSFSLQNCFQGGVFPGRFAASTPFSF